LHAEEADNRHILSDIQIIQTSALHKESLLSEQLHQFISWSSDAICLQRIVQYAVQAHIASGFSNDQMYNLERSFPFLPRIVCYRDKDVAVYHSDIPCSYNRRPLRRGTEKKIPLAQPVKNTVQHCRLFHNEGRYAPNISSFPSIPPPPLASSTETITELQQRAVIFSRLYRTVSGQSVDARDTQLCQQIINDAEAVIADEQISNLSVKHRQYLRYKLRKAICAVRNLQQEAAAYDPTLPHYRPPTTNSILPFLVPLPRRLDNKDPPD
jgi:hypothetical protein